MAAPIAFKYRAFLSYSHRDKAWGAWLHRALESHGIDKDLVGRKTPAGPVPKTLRPIFRDREDFSAGHSLTEQTLAALEASQFLIVVCSPNAARSQYVNEEIRRFKAMGRADRVLPVIVDGEPGDAERECFPPALWFKIGADGTLSDERECPLAADARQQGDGKDLAKQKLVAGLIGVGLDEIVRRAERARRRHNRFWAALAGVFLFLAVAASGSAVYAYQKLIELEERLDQAIEIAYGFVAEATAMSDRAGVPIDVTLGLLRRADTALNRLVERGADTKQLRHRRALMLLGFSDSYRMLGRVEDTISRARDAQNLLVGLTTTDSNNIAWQRDLADANDRLGDALALKGSSDEAIANYRKSLPIRARLIDNHVGYLDALRGLWASNEKLGDLLWAKGLHREAAAVLDDGITLALRSVEASPLSEKGRAYANAASQSRRNARARWNREGPTPWVRAWLRSSFAWLCAGATEGRDSLCTAKFLEIAADVSLLDGKYEDALKAFETSLAQWRTLTEGESANVVWQLAVARAHDNIGDVLGRLNRTDEAMNSFLASRTIRERLAASDPANASWQGELSLSGLRIGDILRTQGKLVQALDSYRASLAGRERLASADPSSTLRRRELAEVHKVIGIVLLDQRDFAAAIKSQRSSLLIIESLAVTDPTNADWQQELAAAHRRIGDVLLPLGDAMQALQSYNAARTIAERLRPGAWQEELVNSYEKIGDGFLVGGHFDEALISYRACVDMLKPLRADLKIALMHEKIAGVFAKSGNLFEAGNSYRASLEIYDFNMFDYYKGGRNRVPDLSGYKRIGVAALELGIFDDVVEPQRSSNRFDERQFAILYPKDHLETDISLNLVVSHWKLAALGDDAVRRYAVVVEILRKLKDENKLSDEQAGWLTLAEKHLTSSLGAPTVQ